MGRTLTTKGLLKQEIQSTICAFVVAVLIHWMKITLQTPDQEPDTKFCHQLEENEAKFGFASLSEFYPFYLCEHSHPYTKLFHFMGTFNVIVLALSLFITSGSKVKVLALALVQGYTFAWISHFFIEHNKPATFRYPTYSFMSDWRLFSDLVLGKFKMF